MKIFNRSVRPLRICVLPPSLSITSPREKGKFFFSLHPTEEEEGTRAISCLCNAALLAIVVEHETKQSSRWIRRGKDWSWEKYYGIRGHGTFVRRRRRRRKDARLRYRLAGGEVGGDFDVASDESAWLDLEAGDSGSRFNACSWCIMCV